MATDLEHKLQNMFFSGLRMPQASDNSSFGCMLSMCTQIFETLMDLNSPNTLTTLLNIIFYALNSGKTDVAQTLLRCFVQLTTAASYQRHLLQRIVNNLSLLVRETPSEQLLHALKTASRSSIEIWTLFVGPIHKDLLKQQVDQILYYGDAASRDQDVVTFKDMIRNCDNFCNPLDHRPWLLRVRYANYLRHIIQDHTEAVRIYSHVIAHGEQLPEEYAAFYLSECHRGKSQCHDAFGDIATAEIELRRAFQIRETAFGCGDALGLTFRVEPEELLLRSGLVDAAAEVRRERPEVIKSMDGETEA